MEAWLVVFAVLGIVFITTGAGGHSGPFRYFLKSSGVTLVVCAILYVGMENASGWDGLGWALFLIGAFGLGCIAGIVAALVGLNAAKRTVIGTEFRVVFCAVGVVFLVGSLVGYKREAIAVSIYRQAVKAGTTSPLAEKIVWGLERWASVGKLPLSSQRDRLIQMISPNSPPDEFWQILLSLPASPERLEVIASFSGDKAGDGDTFITLYDQGDKEAMDVMYEAGNASPGRLLAGVAYKGRLDVARDVLGRGGAKDSRRDILEVAIRADNPEMTALLWENGVRLRKSYYKTPLEYAASRGSIAVVRLFLEMGFDPNAECMIKKAAKYPEIVALLLEHGASASCGQGE